MNPRVKPLVWVQLDVPEFGLTLYTAHLTHGRYYQVYSPYGRQTDYRLWTEAKDMEDPPSGTVNGSSHPSLAAAQAAAQQEWESFVLGALELPEYERPGSHRINKDGS